jgi:uncharacterized protein (TIGR02996 family)
MTHDDAFLQAILSDPDDDAPRLIYADWLDEHGQSERAEFIRVQCELARLLEGDARRKELRTRARCLLAEHGETWCEPLRGLASRCTFRRGFVEHVTVPARVLIGGLDGLRRWAPIRGVLVTVAAELIDQVPGSVAHENLILPLLRERDTLWIGMSNDKDLDLQQKLQFILNRDIIPVVMQAEDLREAINHHYPDATWADASECVLTEFVSLGIDPGRLPEDDLQPRPDDAPVSRLLDLILREAVGQRARVIRLEPHTDHFDVRHRVDGRWMLRDSLPHRILGALVHRIQILAGMDVAQTTVPQRGHIGATIEHRQRRIAVRVRPTEYGPAVAMMLDA